MSRRVALVLAILTVTSMGAAPGRATSDGSVRTPDHPMHAFEQALGSDVPSLLAARRRLLTTPRADGGGGLVPLDGGRAGARPSGFRWTTGFPAPDLDGDGGDDVFVVHHGESRDAALSALRGADGTPLWLEPFEFPTIGGWWNAYGFMDVAGDATPEAIIYREQLTGEAMQHPGVGAARNQSLRQVIEILDAASGELVRTLTYDATVILVSGLLTYATIIENFVLGLASAGDVGGGSSADLLVSLIDHRDVRTIHPSVPTHLLGESVGTARLIDVAAGTEIASARESAPGGFVWFQPAGDLDGDGVPDLAMFKGSVSDGWGGVAGLRADGTRLWDVVATDAVFPAWPVSSASLVDAGTQDILGQVLGPYQNRTIAIRGIDGEQLWDLEGAADLQPVGDVDGGGGQDLMVSSSDELGEDIVVQVVDGATLSPLWQRPHTTEENVGEWGCGYCSQDLTGDGIVDPILGRRSGEDPGPYTLEHVALDGTDGSELWRRFPTAWLDWPGSLNGDVNGNATGDLAIAQAIGDGSGWRLSVEVVEGSDLSALWSVEVRAPGEPGWFEAWVADVDGDGANEIVANVGAETVDGHVATVLAIGSAGLRWAA